jgi:hypothetical protein
VRLRFALHDRNGVSAIYRLGRVSGHEVERDEVRLDAEIPGWLAERIRGKII